MKELLSGLPFRVLRPADLHLTESPAETGTSFLENAAIKAVYYSERPGSGLAVADDSGLSVDAMAGAPGLYSSRFGGEGASDEERNRLLLQRLEGVPSERRGAHFTSAVALARAGKVIFTAVETVEGKIGTSPRGSQGFGYDPLFFYPPFGKTFAEVSPREKAEVSHRGKAFARLRAFLEEFAGQARNGV